MARMIPLRNHGFWKQFDPAPTEIPRIELTPYDSKWWNAFVKALDKGNTK